MSNEVTPEHWHSGILCDSQIKTLCSSSFTEFPMITPFFDKQVKENKVVSYGLSSYGYDVRISDEYKIFSEPRLIYQQANPTIPKIIDPTDFDETIFTDYKGPEIIIPPHGFVLAKTIETIDVPRDVMVICLGKSTWARTGMITNITPLESGWTGEITLELSNTTYLPIRVKSGHGICQLLFFKGSAPCKISYSDRSGKYNNQRGVVPPRILE